MKRLLIGAGLAFSCAAAHSQPATWHFTYTGFYSDKAQAFVPDAVLKGEFSGQDQDGDGVLEKSELSSLLVAHQSWPMNLDLMGCGYSYPYYMSCSLDRFTFSEQGGLHFVGSHSLMDENNGYGEHLEVDTGDTWAAGWGSARTGGGETINYFWTPQTTFNVVSSIPEPAQVWLLALGLGLGVAGARGRLGHRGKALAWTDGRGKCN